MIHQNLDTNSTSIRSVLNKSNIHYMNLKKGSVMQYHFKLVGTNRVKLDNIFGTNKIHGNIENVEQSLMVDWGDGTVTSVYEEIIKTSANNIDGNGITIDHVYTVPMGQNIIISIISEDESYVVKPYVGLDSLLTISKMGGTIANLKDIQGKFNPILNTITEIYSLYSNTKETLFSKFKGKQTNLNNLFSEFVFLETVAEDIFRYNCSHILEINEMFKNTSINSVSVRLFENMTSLISVEGLFSGCDKLITLDAIFSTNHSIQNIAFMCFNCINLRVIDPDMFEHNILLNATSFVENTQCDRILIDNMFELPNTSDIVLNNTMKNIPMLYLTPESVSTFSTTRNFIGTYDNSGTMYTQYDNTSETSEVTFNSFNTKVFDSKPVLTNAERMFKGDPLSQSSIEILQNNSIILKGNTAGHVNIREFLAHRRLEIGFSPFIFDPNVLTVDYTGCFEGCETLYNDETIFGEFFDSNISSGLVHIHAESTFVIRTTEPNQTVKFLSAQNKFNTDFIPDPLSSASIGFGYNEDKVEFDETALANIRTTDGIVEYTYPFIGTYTVTTRNRWCGNFTPVYLTGNETYVIESSDIVLFPTEKSYTGCGTELFHGSEIRGDFFKLFYDRINYLPDVKDGNRWLQYLCTGFSRKCDTIAADNLVSAYYLEGLDTLSNLFTNTYPRLEDKYIKPFGTINLPFFSSIADSIKTITSWFSDTNIPKDELLNIGRDNITQLFTEFVNLEVIDSVLSSCELEGTVNNIDWSNNTKVHSISNVYGLKDSIDWDLINLPLVSSIHNLNVYPVHTGMDAEMMSGKFKDFGLVVGDVDITDMFKGEHLEIPEGFIRNVSGTLTYNDCFYGSYNFELTNESTLFTNVAVLNPSSKTGITFITLKESLDINLEYFNRNKPELDILFKDIIQGGNSSTVLRVYSTAPDIMPSSVNSLPLDNGDFVEPTPVKGEFELTYTVLRRDFNPYTLVFDAENFTSYRIEIWCAESNIHFGEIRNTEIFSMGGVMGSPHWNGKQSIVDLYPGLYPDMIEASPILGGPWKNIKPLNGVVDFTNLFSDIPGGFDNVSPYVLITKATISDTVDLTNLFKNCNIYEFNIQLLSNIESNKIIGDSMFENTKYKSFEIVNIIPAVTPNDPNPTSNITEPFLFMEYLFTKFITCIDMFKNACLDPSLFNGATTWGCDRLGGTIPVSKQTLLDMSGMLTRDASFVKESSNHIHIVPVFNMNQLYKLESIQSLFKGQVVSINPELATDILNLPNTVGRLNASSYLMNISTVIDETPLMIYADNIMLNKATNATDAYNTNNSNGNIFGLLTDVNWLVVDNSINDDIVATRMFGSNTFLMMYAGAQMILVEPFSDTHRRIVGDPVFLEDSEVDLPSMSAIKPFYSSYAPDDILFRNTGGLVGNSGITKLEYPSFIEYQDITLTGNTLVFVREDITPDWNRSVYLTVNIKYGLEYEEEWHVVKAGVDTYEIQLDPSKIVDSKVTVKIQSELCFFLTDTNITSAKALVGSFYKRTNTSPGVNNDFDFGAKHMWFIESFGEDLWRDVKIKEGSIGFKFNKDPLLRTMGYRPFRNQSHLKNIDKLFLDCRFYNPTDDVLFGLSNVISAREVFRYTSITDTRTILKNIPKVEKLDGVFSNGIKPVVISDDTFKFNTRVTSLRYAFSTTDIDPVSSITPLFFNSVLNTISDVSYMFHRSNNLNLINNGMSLPYNLFNFTKSSINTSYMFADTNLIDVPLELVRSGSFTNAIGMFMNCITFSDETEFINLFSIHTNVVFKTSIALEFIGSLLTGKFDKVSNYLDVKFKPIAKLVFNRSTDQNMIRYMTYTELTTTGIQLDTIPVPCTSVEIYSDDSMLLQDSNVTSVLGSLPCKAELDTISASLGIRYPNLETVGSKLLWYLIEQKSVSGLFESISDINVVPGNIFERNINITDYSNLFKNAKGSYILNPTMFTNKPELVNCTSMFENVDISVVPKDLIYFSKTNIDITGMFKNTNAMVAKDFIRNTSLDNITVNITDTLLSCKTLYTDAEILQPNIIQIGTTGATIVNYFNPVINIPSVSSSMEIFPMHDSVDPLRVSDVMVDFDGNTKIFKDVKIDANFNVTHLFENIPGLYSDIRIWSGYYSLGVKESTDTNSKVTTSLKGYLGREIRPLRSFIKTYMPNATSISSECLHRTNRDNFAYFFLMSGITSIPASILKRVEGVPDIVTVGQLLEGASELTSVSIDMFKDFNNGIVQLEKTPMDCSSLFFSCMNLPTPPDDILKPLIDMNYIVSSVTAMMTACYTVDSVPAFLKETEYSTAIKSTRRLLESTSIKSIPSTFMSGATDMTELNDSFKNLNSLVVDRDFIVDSSKLSLSGIIDLRSIFLLTADTRRYDYRLLEYREGLTLNIEDSLKGNHSIYSEDEIFGHNETIGLSKLVTDTRYSMSFTVSAGSLILNPGTSAVHEKPVIVKVNGIFALIAFYIPGFPISLSNLSDNDIVEIIMFEEENHYYTKDSMSTSKIIKLGGIHNTKLINNPDGTVYVDKSILELYGPDVEEIEDGFFSRYTQLTNATGLCKGLYKLNKLGPLFMDDFVNVTDWTSFFENCESLVLSEDNEDFFKFANKGVQYDYMFKNNYSMTMIPQRFFKGCLAQDKTFIGTFMNNTSLTDIPNDIDEF